MALTAEQIGRFKWDGFLLHEPVLTEAEVDHLTDCYEATLARLEGERALENVQSGGEDDAVAQVFQIRTAHLQHPAFNMLIHDVRILDRVACLLGPDLRLVHYQGVYKPPRTGGVVGWHQDNHYFEVEGDRTVSVWLALDDATPENGCMWYLPGGHDRPLPHRQLWDSKTKKGFYFAIPDLDDSAAVPAPVKRGGLAIHHCLMPHRSLHNRTDRPRRGLAMHFMDATVAEPGFLRRGLLPGATPVLRRRGAATPAAQR